MSSVTSDPPSETAAALLTAAPARERLFTPRFLMMCGFNFIVFLSAMQLLPTAPFRILDVGGSKLSAGLFLGFLTYASAFSAPLTGAIADRIGRRRTLVFASLAIFAMSIAYGLTSSHRPMLAIVLLHGVFWSALLTAGGAYVTDLMPATRRAEGIGYYGLSTILAMAVAPIVGLWVYRHGWLWLCVSIGVLNLAMAAVAWRLPEMPRRPRVAGERWLSSEALEWRVVIAAGTLFLLAFGYGGVTSFVAIYTRELGISPHSLYFSVMAGAMVLTRPLSGTMADRLGATRIVPPALVLTMLGYALLALTHGKGMLIVSAALFGAGYGAAYPAFAAHVIRHVEPHKRAAAFGGILAALDTGIGSGSITLGWIIEHHGFTPAYTVAAVMAALSIPYFLATSERVFRGTRVA